MASCLTKIAELWLGTGSQAQASSKFGYRETSRGQEVPSGTSCHSQECAVGAVGEQRFKPNKGPYKCSCDQRLLCFVWVLIWAGVEVSKLESPAAL